jgi:hypothetical protein
VIERVRCLRLSLNYAARPPMWLLFTVSTKIKPSLGVLVNDSLLSINFFLRLGPRAGTLDDLGDFRVVLHPLFQPLRLYKNDVAPEKKPS